MTSVEELEKYVKDNGILGISGGIFKDHVSPKGKQIKANTTVAEYCNTLAEMYGTDGETYAAEILAIEAAPTREIVGECSRCWTLIMGDEEHVCDEARVKQQAAIDAKLEDLLYKVKV